LKVRSIFIKNIEHERTSLIIYVNLEKFEALFFSKLSCQTFLIYNINAKISIIFVLKRMNMLRLSKQ